MTTSHPVPTPPPSEPAPSLRPVEELQALCDAATDGPWTTQRWSLGLTVCDEDGRCLIDSDHGAVPAFERPADAEFIAAARTALPSLLARLRAAEETLAAVGALCDAADEASMRPDDPNFEPIDVPWTVAVRAILEVSR